MLGLTFTTKAASELRSRIRQALRGCRRARRGRTPSDEDVLEPTVATYNAYAAGLLTDHGLRIGHEPDTRVITDAARYQLGARVVDRLHRRGRGSSPTTPQTVIQNLLALDGAMSEHLVGARRRARGSTREPAPASCGRCEEERRARTARPTASRSRRPINAIDRRGELLGLVDGLPPAQGATSG